MRISAPLAQAQLIETAILNIVNFQTLIASKTSHIISAAKGADILELEEPKGATQVFTAQELHILRELPVPATCLRESTLVYPLKEPTLTAT